MVHMIKECSIAWETAGREFGVRVVAPYELKDENISILFAAYLPDFGSASGCYLYPISSAEETVEWKSIYAWAQKYNYYVSFINAAQYCNYDRVRFEEALRDWMYFGSELHRPKGMK